LHPCQGRKRGRSRCGRVRDCLGIFDFLFSVFPCVLDAWAGIALGGKCDGVTIGSIGGLGRFRLQGRIEHLLECANRHAQDFAKPDSGEVAPFCRGIRSIPTETEILQASVRD